RASGVLALGLLSPLALAAAQLLPAAEFAAGSLRGHRLQLIEMRSGHPLLDWASFRAAAAERSYELPGSIVFAALAPLAVANPGTRRQAVFYALVFALFAALAVDGPVLRLYLHAPFGLGRAFRFPDRHLWIAGLGAALLTALGAQALARAPTGGRIGRPLLVLAGATVMWGVGGTRPPLPELCTVAALALLAALAPLPRAAGDGSLATAVAGAAARAAVPPLSPRPD